MLNRCIRLFSINFHEVNIAEFMKKLKTVPCNEKGIYNNNIRCIIKALKKFLQVCEIFCRIDKKTYVQIWNWLICRVYKNALVLLHSWKYKCYITLIWTVVCPLVGIDEILPNLIDSTYSLRPPVLSIAFILSYL